MAQPSLLGKKWPAPVARPFWPFLAAGVVMTYTFTNLATALSNTDEYKNDPRNPAAKTAKKDH